MSDDFQIRERFRKAARSIEPSERAWESLQARLNTGGVRPTHPLVALLASALISAITLTFVWLAFTAERRDGPVREAEDSTLNVGPEQPEVTAVVKVPGEPQSVAATESSAWVASIDGNGRCSSTVTRVDEAAANPTIWASLNFAVDKLAIGGGALWATGASCRTGGGYDGVIARIDQGEKNSVREKAVSHGAGTSAVAFWGGHVWVTVEQGPGGEGGKLLRVDPKRLDLTGTAEFTGIVGGLGSTMNAVLIGETQTRDDSPSYDLLWIDPVTLGVERRIVVEMMGSFLTTNGVVWVQQRGDEAVTLDSVTGNPTMTPLVVNEGGGFTPFGADETGVWYLSEDDDGRAIIEHLNIGSRQPDERVRVPREPVAQTATPSLDTAWVASFDGSMLRIDLR